MPEVTFKVGSVEFSIDFADQADLEQKLSLFNATKIAQLISETFHISSPPESAQGFDDLVQISERGQIKLLHPPSKKTDQIKLTLFFSSEGLSTEEIKQYTGVSNPRSYMTKQDFIKSGKKFALSADARAFVANKLIPSLRSK